MFSFFGRRAADPTSGHIATSNSSEEYSPVVNGPPPSLWPEATRPIPTAARQITSANQETLDVSRRAGRVLEGANAQREESADAECTVPSNLPSNHATTTQINPSSTLQSSSLATSYSYSRPIDISTPKVFEPHYPMWLSYPPIHPTRFETSPPSSPSTDTLPVIMHTFMEESKDFKNFADKKNAERIQLRHGSDYEKLVEKLRQQQYIYKEGPTPQIRAAARERVLEIEAEMTEKRKELSGAELQHIREIEKAWISLVSMDVYEQTIARQRHLSAIPKAETKKPLSKVERLLGSDGSSSEHYEWTRSSPTAPRPLPNNEPSHAEVRLPFMDSNLKDTEQRQTNMPESSLPLVGTHSCPDAPYEILLPDWFHVIEAQGEIELKGDTIEDRYKQLLNHIYQLEIAKSQREYKEKHPDEDVTVRDHTWYKNWHEPNPGWRYQHHREHGGWWKCRKGPTATYAENMCKVCSTAPIPQPPSPAQQLDFLMGYINEAMAVITEKDKKDALLSRQRAGGNTVGRRPPQNDDYHGAAGRETPQFRERQPLINYNSLQHQYSSRDTQTGTSASIQKLVADEEMRRNGNDKKTT
ncbi:hypothetical protein GGR50DRAFT_692471 [Xylaria sp. CBS 124048]|nr:hypothetical protein GGR50DRAFT_692471 [Xylaria sp. CBS 124048]